MHLQTVTLWEVNLKLRQTYLQGNNLNRIPRTVLDMVIKI